MSRTLGERLARLLGRKPPDMQVAAFCMDGKGKILLVTSRGTGRWIVPKGWVERGVAAADQAAQEAFEEAGVQRMNIGFWLGVFLPAKAPPAVVDRARDILAALESGAREGGAKPAALIDDLPLFRAAPAAGPRTAGWPAWPHRCSRPTPPRTCACRRRGGRSSAATRAGPERARCARRRPQRARLRRQCDPRSGDAAPR